MTLDRLGVSWLSGACHVYTDSFHAIIFSLKYKVNVLAFYTEEIRAPRLLELGEEFSISDVVIPVDSNSISKAVAFSFDWSRIQSQIEESKSNSMKTLDLALSK